MIIENVAMNLYKVVETDNSGCVYFDEKFIEHPTACFATVTRLADVMNDMFDGSDTGRYWKVVDDRYELQKGSES